MPGLSYPFTYVCLQCNETTTITRSDAEEAHSNPDSTEARQIVLKQRGWRPEDDELLCHDCAGSNE